MIKLRQIPSMIDNPYYVWYNTRDSKDRHINPDVIMRSYPSGPPKNARKFFRAFLHYFFKKSKIMLDI